MMPLFFYIYVLLFFSFLHFWKRFVSLSVHPRVHTVLDLLKNLRKREKKDINQEISVGSDGTS